MAAPAICCRARRRVRRRRPPRESLPRFQNSVLFPRVAAYEPFSASVKQKREGGEGRSSSDGPDRFDPTARDPGDRWVLSTGGRVARSIKRSEERRVGKEC